MAASDLNTVLGGGDSVLGGAMSYGSNKGVMKL